jgi:hypothetical protein
MKEKEEPKAEKGKPLTEVFAKEAEKKEPLTEKKVTIAEEEARKEPPPPKKEELRKSVMTAVKEAVKHVIPRKTFKQKEGIFPILGGPEKGETDLEQREIWGEGARKYVFRTIDTPGGTVRGYFIDGLWESQMRELAEAFIKG